MKIRRLALCLTACLLLVGLIVPVAIQAEPPTHAYTYNNWQTAVSSPLMYVPDELYSGKDMGMTDKQMVKPSDMYIQDETGKMYIASEGSKESGTSGSVLRIDMATMQVEQEYTYAWFPMTQREINRVDRGRYTDPYQKVPTDDPEVFEYYKLEPFGAITGVFVTQAGDIYVADHDNARVIRMDQDGFMTGLITEPDESAVVASNFKFQPNKLVVDASGTVYILCDGGTRGAFMMTPSDGGYILRENGTPSEDLDGGSFLGFYGANRVRANFRLLLDLTLKRILPKQYRSSLSSYVPTEMTNLFIDETGFIYTVTQSKQGTSSSQTDQVRKLNYSDSNILLYRGESKNYGDLDIARVDRIDQLTQFVDVTVDERGFITALDLTYARMFQYDQEANTLVIQGKGRASNSDQVGTTELPVSIENYNGYVYVLDQTLCQITSYRLTEYGKNLQDAIYLYNQGKYEEAVDYWHEVLKRNANNELAYTGLGRAYMKKDDFQTALYYLRLGYDKQAYSDVFQQYRGVWLANNFGMIAVIVILLILLPFVWPKRHKFVQWVKRIFRRKEA